MSMKNAIILFVTVCILCVVFYYIEQNIRSTFSEQSRYYNTIDSLNEQVDSLNQEIFLKQITIGRYEVAFEMFKEENPKAAQEFELILSTKTE